MARRGERAAHKALSELFKRDKIKGEIDRDRVHTDPNERHAPSPPSPNLDDLIKGGEKEARIATRDEHVGRGPDLLDYRKLKSPKKPQPDGANTTTEQEQHLFLIRHARISE